MDFEPESPSEAARRWSGPQSSTNAEPNLDMIKHPRRHPWSLDTIKHPRRHPWSLVERLNTFFVAVCKLIGFALLGVIVMAMAGYLTSAGFYQLSDRWAVPERLGPDSERVQSETARYFDNQV